MKISLIPTADNPRKTPKTLKNLLDALYWKVEWDSIFRFFLLTIDEKKWFHALCGIFPGFHYIIMIMHNVIGVWRESLSHVLQYYDRHRGRLSFFLPKLFLFFLILNLSCYWWGMFTAFADHVQGSGWTYYLKIQFPVGFLGALFDSLSFFVTLYILRRAIQTRRTAEYVAHLSIDAVIAVLATFWVLFVFSFSGWLIKLFEATPRPLAARNAVYEKMLVDAVSNPGDNWRNIYFGIIMGVSASLPTCVHIFMFLRASVRSLTRGYKVWNSLCCANYSRIIHQKWRTAKLSYWINVIIWQCSHVFPNCTRLFLFSAPTNA